MDNKTLSKVITFDDVEPLVQKAFKDAERLGLLLHINADDLKSFLRLNVFFMASGKKPYAEYVNLLQDMKAYGKGFLQKPVKIDVKGLSLKIEGSSLEIKNESAGMGSKGFKVVTDSRFKLLL